MTDVTELDVKLPQTEPSKPAKKVYKNMEKRSSQRQSATDFWRKNKAECLGIKSVKEVFQKYKAYCVQEKMECLNEYIFRTYIRKNGYCNSGKKKTREERLEKMKKRKEEKEGKTLVV